MNLQQLDHKIEEKLKSAIHSCIDISHFVFEHAELGGQETKSAAYIADVLKQYGFSVEFPYGNLAQEKLDEIGMPPGETLETAFVAEYGEADAEVTIAFLAEYDALPGFGPQGQPGHACGHNWIAATMAGCGIALSAAAEETKCKVRVIGTPAEETYGAKVNMAKLGVFDHVDFIFQAHLSDKYAMEVPTLAMYSIEFDFHGKSAHAAINPETGINALDGVISMFNSINALRQHVGRDAIMHGIITEGGVTSNVIPDFAQCQFEIREKSRGKLDALRGRVIAAAEAAALATGCKVEYRDYENHNDELINLKSMTEICSRYFVEEGIKDFVAEADYKGAGSTDLGNVSYICPTLYAEVKLADGTPVHVHDRGALELVDSAAAHESMAAVIRVFAKAACEIAVDKDKARKIKEEFLEKRSKKLL